MKISGCALNDHNSFSLYYNGQCTTHTFWLTYCTRTDFWNQWQFFQCLLISICWNNMLFWFNRWLMMILLLLVLLQQQEKKDLWVGCIIMSIQHLINIFTGTHTCCVISSHLWKIKYIDILIISQEGSISDSFHIEGYWYSLDTLWFTFETSWLSEAIILK